MNAILENICPIKGLLTIEVIRVNGDRELVCKDNPNLLTNAGRDWIHNLVYGGTGTGTTKYIALTTDAAAASASDTTLASEIVVSDLQRTAGTVTHTGGTNTTTVAKTFTAANPYTSVQKTGLFTASSSGTLVHESVFSPVNLQSGDQLSITWTITAG